MKKVLLLICILAIIGSSTNAQSVAINENGSSPDGSAILDIQSSTKGTLFPRMTEAERNAISSPAKGLVIYQTDGTEGYYYNSGTPAAPNWTKVTTDKSSVAFSANTTVGQVLTGGYIKIQFNTEEYDESSNFVHGATSEFTAPSAGIYRFATVVTLQGPAGPRYDVAFFVNGVQRKNYLVYPTQNLFSLSLTADFKLVASDKVDVRIYSSGSTNIVAGSAQWVYFSGHKVN